MLVAPCLAPAQVQLSELRLAHTAARVAELERGSRGSGNRHAGGQAQPPPLSASVAPTSATGNGRSTSALDYWYPVSTSSSVGPRTLVPLSFRGRPWVLFRDAANQPALVLDECAHRACPLSLGSVTPHGTVACPYHGWEYTSNGDCTHMPSCTFLPGVGVDALPVVEADDFLWLWPGAATPAGVLPRLTAPPGFTLMASISLDVEHPPHEVLLALLSSAQLPDVMKPVVGAWDAAAAVSCSFEPPGMVLSTLKVSSSSSPRSAEEAAAPASQPSRHDASLAQPHAGATLDASTGSGGLPSQLLHQVHVVIPTSATTCRVLYRLAINWAGGTLLTMGPAAPALWRSVAEEVLQLQVAALTDLSVAAVGIGGDSAAHTMYAQWRAGVADAI
jgi:chlorophyllide a oxygenase